MPNYQRAVTLLAFLFLGQACESSKNVAPNNSKPKPYVVLEPIKQTKIKKGQSAKVALSAKIPDPKIHVQAHNVQPPLIPTKLTISPPAGIEIKNMKYPKAKPFRMKGAENDIMVYEKAFKITFDVVAKPSVKTGPLKVGGKLRYQACNETTCFFPKNAQIYVPLLIQ